MGSLVGFFSILGTLQGGKIFELVKAFLEGQCNIEDINETDIVLIPKVEKPECITQFRPIGFCNFIYKIISKVIVNRMKNLQPLVVSKHQRAFIP